MKRWVLCSLFLLIAVVLMAGCSVNPSKVDDKYAKEFASKIAYVKDARTGLCFALVGTRKTGHASESGLGMACVPCERVPRGLLVIQE